MVVIIIIVTLWNNSSRISILSAKLDSEYLSIDSNDLLINFGVYNEKIWVDEMFINKEIGDRSISMQI